MEIKLNPKFELGQTVYKVCDYCYACTKGHYAGCGIDCYEQYSRVVLKTKVDGYQVTKNNDKYEILYHIENGSLYTYSYEKEKVLFKSKKEAEDYLLNQ